MSNLSGFRKDVPRPARSPGHGTVSGFKPQPSAPRQPFDRDRCPAGYHPDVWHLALSFEQSAKANGIELRAGRPVIYSEIDALVTHHGLRGKTYRHRTALCKNIALHPALAAHCWLHLPELVRTGHGDSDITWVQMVEVIIREFWSRIWDEHALDHFRQHFQEYGQAALDHWRDLAITRDIASQPARPRVRRVRQEPLAGTMADASKEG